MRREIARELRHAAKGLYAVDQEAVTGEEKETDIRLRSRASDHEAVIEIKLAEKGGLPTICGTPSAANWSKSTWLLRIAAAAVCSLPWQRPNLEAPRHWRVHRPERVENAALRGGGTGHGQQGAHCYRGGAYSRSAQAIIRQWPVALQPMSRMNRIRPRSWDLPCGVSAPTGMRRIDLVGTNNPGCAGAYPACGGWPVRLVSLSRAGRRSAPTGGVRPQLRSVVSSFTSSPMAV